MGNQSITVLVVDDNEVVRMMIARVLKRNGFRVLLADGGLNAIAVCESYEEPIHVALVDYTMQGMKGPDVIEYLKLTRPGIKMLLMSGYPESYAKQKPGAESASVGYLSKPFTAANLLEAINRELGLTDSA